MGERKWEGCRGKWRVWLWQCSPGGLWDCLSEAIPSMGGLIRFITSQISGGACCQIELSAWPVIRASNEDRTSLRPGTAQMTPRPGSVQEPELHADQTHYSLRSVDNLFFHNTALCYSASPYSYTPRKCDLSNRWQSNPQHVLFVWRSLAFSLKYQIYLSLKRRLQTCSIFFWLNHVFMVAILVYDILRHQQ